MINCFISGKSIKHPLILFFIVITVVLLGSGVLVLTAKNIQERNFENYNSNLEMLSRLSIYVNSAQKNIDRFFKTDEESYYKKYISDTSYIDNCIVFLSDRFYLTDYALDLRIIENVNDFCNLFITNIDLLKENDPSFYDRQQFFIKAMTVMNGYISSWLSSYISSEGEVYRQTLISQRKTANIIIYTVLVAVIIIYIVAFKVLKKITLQLDSMVCYAKQLTVATWDIEDLPTDCIAELNTLSNAINIMKKSLNDYFIRLKESADIKIKYQREKQENAEKSRLLYQTKYSLLAQRLDPHFLFNALNIIYRKSMFEEQDDIMNVVESLAEVLRYNLEINREFVSLDKELKALDSYIYIHKLRFEERITIEQEINCNTSEIFLTPFLLQPLIENLLSSAARTYNSVGNIKLDLSMTTENKLEIDINYLNSEITAENPEKYNSNILPETLSTLKERLKLIYSDNAVLKEKLEKGFYRINLVLPVLNCEKVAVIKDV